MNMEELGYGDWHRNSLRNSAKSETSVARIVAVDRDRYMIGSEFGSIPAELTGKLAYCAETSEDIPCVGDWVLVHVGFAMNKISEEDAQEQMRTLRMLGEADAAAQEVRGYGLEEAEDGKPVDDSRK